MDRLDEDFFYLVLPDACIDIVFDMSRTPEFNEALIMTPSVDAVSLSLGKQFSFVGIRFLPGAWLDTPELIVGETAYAETLAGHPMAEFRQKLTECADFTEQTALLRQLAVVCRQHGLVKSNAAFAKVLDNYEQIASVQDMADISGYSPRHFQRICKAQTGYSPHDFLTVIRFQQALTQDAHAYYDQSHYIRQFKRITGLTPGSFHLRYQ